AEGFYLHVSELHYTLPPKKYPIPNNYFIKTTWRRGKNQKTVQCKINYINRKPEFQILYGASFEFKIKSNVLASRAATNYKKAINNNLNKKFGLSRPLLFRLQLQKLQIIREFQAKQYRIKPIDQYTRTTLWR
ncbi:36622_t:CDS:1, partial [Racocetra persica]